MVFAGVQGCLRFLPSDAASAAFRNIQYEVSVAALFVGVTQGSASLLGAITGLVRSPALRPLMGSGVAV